MAPMRVQDRIESLRSALHQLHERSERAQYVKRDLLIDRLENMEARQSHGQSSFCLRSVNELISGVQELHSGREEMDSTMTHNLELSSTRIRDALRQEAADRDRAADNAVEALNGRARELAAELTAGPYDIWEGIVRALEAV